MIGQAKSQRSLLDSVFNRRKKRSRTDKLLTQIDNFVDWERLAKEIEPIFKKSKRSRPTVPSIYSLKCSFIQYMYDLSEPQLEYAVERPFAHFKSRYGRARYVTRERNEFHFKMLCSIFNIRRKVALSMS